MIDDKWIPQEPKGKEAYDHLIALQRIFREVDREDLEDATLEIMDAVIGWCSPETKVDWPVE